MKKKDLNTNNLSLYQALNQEDKEKVNSFFEFLSKKFTNKLIINAYINFYIENINKHTCKNNNEADYHVIKKQKDKLINYITNMKQIDLQKYNFSGIWEVISFGLVLMYIVNLANKTFVINPFIDNLVAAVFLAITLRCLMIRINVIKTYHLNFKYMTIEIITLVLCFFLKLITRQVIDITFLLLVIMYLFTKKQVTKQMNQFEIKI